MVTLVEPSVHLLGETKMIPEGMASALEVLGAPDWKTDAETDAETLIEFGGRLCYLSFNEDLNPNVTRVREGNRPYLGNILKSGHGSVVEHAVCNFAFLNTTPVFTHELVRHRAGTMFSQTSGRFVRLDEIHFFMPDAFDAEKNEAITAEMAAEINSEAMALLEHMEFFQKRVASITGIDDMDFHQKKVLTSAMRRLAPYGIRTHIMFSANHRALRHIIDVRNAFSVEEEPNRIFSEVGEIMVERYPALYQDAERDADGFWTFGNRKV